MLVSNLIDPAKMRLYTYAWADTAVFMAVDTVDRY
jgi:hypothetical protein